MPLQILAGNASPNSSIAKRDLRELAKFKTKGKEYQELPKISRLLCQPGDALLALEHVEAIPQIKTERAI